MLYAIIAVLVIIVDQWVKYWVSGAIPIESTGVPLVNGILSLVNVHNDGAAFSFLSGANARIYFIVLTGVFTVAVIIALATRFVSGPLARWSLVLVTAGGLSNCIDRIIYGYVQDMFKIDLFNFPVFNVADVFITVFCILFALAIIFGRDRKKDDFDYDDEFAEEDLEEEEEEKPRRVSRKAAKRAAAAAAAQEEAPARKTSRKGRKKGEEEDEYEQFKAQRAARQQAEAEARAAAAAKAEAEAAAARQQAQEKPAPAVEDPFAAWERANARQQAAQQAAAPVEPAPAPAVHAAPETSAPAPARKPAAKPSVEPDLNMDFSLEDILAEFK